MDQLYDKLINYSENDCYGFHMPGHKRNIKHMKWDNPFQIDITEIEGFDNLHHAVGILKQTSQRAADLFRSEETLMSVGGSTACLLSAVAGTVSKRGKILIARNCHKSVYHSVFLGEMEAEYLYPEIELDYNLNGGILPRQVKEKLESDSSIEAVLITSPTYEGFCSDVEGISGICHQFKIPLIVDQAHGAHFGFAGYFPESAVVQGADIVVNSLHKTLPALTQTAIMHLNGDLADRERIKKYMAIYQSSSPSYVLMGSIDYCLGFLEKKDWFQLYEQKIKEFRLKARRLKNIKLVSEEVKGSAGIHDMDISKLVFSLKGTSVSGQQLYDQLRKKYKLQMELAASDFIVGISTIMDEESGFERLLLALQEIDSQIERKGEEKYTIKQIRNEKIWELAETDGKDSGKVNLYSAEGMVSAGYVYLYPPGIPLLVPGEKISSGLLEMFRHYEECGLLLEGVNERGQISIITEYEG